MNFILKNVSPLHSHLEKEKNTEVLSVFELILKAENVNLAFSGNALEGR